MQKQAKLILLFIFLWLVQKAQGQTGKRAENTIQKVDNDQSQYSKKQLRWLNREGFDTEIYSWTNDEINLNIKKSLVSRKRANITTAVGLSLLVLNLTYNAMGILVHELSEDPDKGSFQSKNGLYFVGGTVMATSLVFHINKDSKLKKAKQLYANSLN